MITKNVLKIILVLQLLACALATYGHPDAEVFSLSRQPSRDELLVEAAIKRGMDGEAVAELLRTRKPVTRTTTTPGGTTKTTTYKLEPDGSISSKSVLKSRNRYVYNADAIPDELKNAPAGTHTRTFTDSDGNKVTQTMSVSHGRPLPASNPEDDLSSDWFSKSLPSWQDETPPSPTSFNTAHKTITRTYTTPTGERKTVQYWSSDPVSSEPERPSTATLYSPNRRTIPSKPRFPPSQSGDHPWPSFDYAAFSHSWDNTAPDDTDDWKVLKEPETTTQKTFGSWDWPHFPTYPTRTTTTVKPIESTTRKPLPNLSDFLKSQYGPNANSETTTIATPKPAETTTHKSLTSTPKFIKIEDLPVIEVLHNGRPASESILKSLPPHLTPRTPTEHVLSIDHKHPIEQDFDEDIDEYKSKTNIRSFSTTLIGPEKPTLKDLDPQMQDILRNAGIVPEIEGDSITKTRKEPDGRIITTSYKVNTVPLAPPVPPPLHSPYSHTFNANKSPFLPLAPLTPHFSPITEFLAKLGLTKYDIASRNGHYTKTFIDENGDVLTATFVFSSPQGVKAEEKPSVKPDK